ncbi:MAG TPA: Ig-like domain repeat protein, partial [Actinomycetota bacterium]|nr:Ig-like domain repeat protein [Actinomycetota bacterium]
VNDATTKQGQDYSTTAGEYRQGCFACHGIHYFITGDTDNAMSPAKTTEIDGQQWQWAAPTEQPMNVGDRYANTVKAPLVASVVTTPNTPQDATVTTVAITGATGGTIGETVTLAGRLTDGETGIAGKELAFSLRGEPVGSAITDENGDAAVQTTLTGPAEATQQTVTFEGEGQFTPSSVTENFEVARVATELALTGEASGQTSDKATVSARLTSNGNGLSGREVVFTLGDEEVGRATTDESGGAAVQTTLSGAARTVDLSASFAGDGGHDPASATGPFEIRRDDSVLRSTSSLRAGRVTATATLTDADSGAGLEGRTIRFLANGVEVATAVTDAQGVATTTFKGKKSTAVTASFDGDDSYNASQS